MSSADAPYAELHCHSAYSFQDGASQPDELVFQAAELGYTHLALTDHDNLAGAMEFAQACRSAGITGIIGSEVTVHDEQQRVAHVTLLARTRVGYANLCRLLTLAWAPRTSRGGLWLPGADAQPADEVAAAWLESGEHAAKAGGDGAWKPYGAPPGRERRDPTRPRGSAERPDPLVSLQQLCDHAEGLTLLTGCATRGLLLADLRNDRPGHAVELLQRLQGAFGREHVHVELQLPRQRGDAARNRALRQVAEQAGAAVVATGNVHAHTTARARLHEVLVAVRHHTTLDGCEEHRAGNLTLAMRSPEAMADRFHDHADAIAATLRIAESIEFDLTEDLGYSYPDLAGAGSSDELLARICHGSFAERYDGRASESQGRQRMEAELAVIARHGLAGFFLIHRDILELAREVALQVRGPDSARAVNPPGRGRGSSVESIVCYLTGLSHVDPIEANLRMGRFLNEDLASTPDIDLDFPRDIRYELLKRVVARYGTDRCAMVAAHATYRAKGAIRDVGAALGLPAAELARISRRCDTYSAHGVAEATDGTGPRWDAFRRLTAEIAGLPRQIGQHSGGVIVSTDPLCDMVPIQPTAMRGRQICQWDKDSCADAGFLKIDVLGLGMLSAVEETVETIAGDLGERIDLSRIDYGDQAVYEDIRQGDTVGVFQIESRAQIQSIKRVKPDNLHDLTIQVALIRPGPIIGNSVNPYVALREAQRLDPTAKPTYDHPILEPVLRDTAGAIIFQDQVIEVAMAAAGFSAGEADGLRRAMTRKRTAGSIERYRERFVEGAAKQGLDAPTATTIFERLIGFCHYGFPRAHSVAFALLAYQSTWLRHYYPAHFFAALLNAQPMGFYPADTLLRDAARHGVGALAVDVNASSGLCDVMPGSQRSEDRIRVGLGFVRGINYEEALELQRERDVGGPFVDLGDLARRARLRTDQLEQLVMCGATDCFEEPRRRQLWQLGQLSRPRRSGGSRRTVGLDAAAAAEPAVQQEALSLAPGETPEFAQLSLWDQVAADYAATGLSVRAHPVGLLRDVLPNVATTADVEVVRHGTTCDVVGVVVARQRPSTARGVIFLLLEDEHGTVNVIVPPPVYRDARLTIRSEAIVRVRGRVERHGDVINLVATGVWRLPAELRRRAPATPAGKRFA